MYIWEQSDWPHFRWDKTVLRARLDAIRLLQGRLLGHTEAVARQDLELEMEALIQSAMRTSEIEGEYLDADSVRSAVAHQLGLERAETVGRTTPQSESLVALLLEATYRPDESLSQKRLCQWQALLFPERSERLSKIRVGDLRGELPMQVVSGRLDQPKVHFEAPPRQGLEAELSAFITWFNHPPANLDPLLRAGIAHLWLITLHPFEDGNGRVTRAVTDRALAQAERQSVRFYSLSAAIMARRSAYYDHLEHTQSGGLDITRWLGWFLDTLEEALQQAMSRVSRVSGKARFWQRHATTPLNERQIRLLNWLLDTESEEFEQGINAQEYQSLTKVSKATATRDLSGLLEKGCLQKLPGGGRSTRYGIALAGWLPCF